MKHISFTPKGGPQCTLDVSESTAPSIVGGNTGVLDAVFFGQLIRDRVSSPPSFKLAEKGVREKIASMTWSPREFQKAHTLTTKAKGHGTGDKHRHILRQIVMETTVAAVERGKYSVPTPQPLAAAASAVASAGKTDSIDIDNASIRAKGSTQYYKGEKRQLPKRCNAAASTSTPTKVEVVNQDCLECAHSMATKEGLNPVVLNMANAKHPGGGYLKGDGAQEENLMRRSNYYLALDPDLNGSNPNYPIGGSYSGFGSSPFPYERDAVYTKGATVFRGTEANGYPFLPEPYQVSLIATASYRWPTPVKAWDVVRNHNDKLAVVRIKAKLDVILAAAVEKGHDSIVLSALGCGAFNNPPEQVAGIFHAALSSFNGLFKKVVFAITDDHNSSTASGVSNFQFFSHYFEQNVLDRPSGSIKVLDCREHQTVCDHGAMCDDRNERRHAAAVQHPGECPHLLKCVNKDPIHRLLFAHECPHGAKCERWADDPSHLELFGHPDMCKFGGDCTDLNEDHLNSFLHLPICPEGKACIKPAHACRKWHVELPCEYGAFCPDFQDKKHWNTYFHPQKQVCDDAAYCMVDTKVEPDHYKEWAHVCVWGSQCKDKDDPAHQANYLHIQRAPCPEEAKGGVCTRRKHDEEHIDLYGTFFFSFFFGKLKDTVGVRRLLSI